MDVVAECRGIPTVKDSPNGIHPMFESSAGTYTDDMGDNMKIEPWVYDLVTGLVKYEDEHSKEHTCLSEVLDGVPDDVKNSVRLMEESAPLIRKAALNSAAEDIMRFARIGATPNNQISETAREWRRSSGLACESGSDVYSHIANWLSGRANAV